MPIYVLISRDYILKVTRDYILKVARVDSVT